MKAKDETRSDRLHGEPWDLWSSSLDNSLTPDVASQYLKHFLGFLEWADLDTETLYQGAVDDMNSSEPIRRMRLGKRIVGYQEHMRDELGYSAENEDGEVVATPIVLTPKKAIMHFFKSLGINQIPINGGVKILHDTIAMIDHEQIGELLGATGNYRNKALILFLKDSGLRVSDARRVTLGMIRNAERRTVNGEEYLTFEIKQQKTKNMANPVLGPESLAALDKWAGWREKKGLPSKNADYLFCSIKKLSEYTDGNGIYHSGVQPGDQMGDRGPSVIIGQIVRKCGMHRDEDGAPTKISAHSTRKFTQTLLEYGAMPRTWINRATGRKGVGTDGIYSKPNPDLMIERYAEAYSKLRIFGGPMNEEVRNVKEQLQRVKNERYDQMGEVASLRREVAGMRELLARIEEGGYLKSGWSTATIPPEDSEQPEKRKRGEE